MQKMSRSEAGRLGWKRSKKYHEEKKKERLTQYEANPTKCSNCDKVLSYEKRRNKFCGHSCAAAKNNLGVVRHGKFRKTPCIRCGKITKNTYCSVECHKEYVWEGIKKDIEDNGFNNLSPYSKLRKRYLLETTGNKCEICDITEWMGNPVPIVMDHINGNSEDNSIKNLRLICPNCDAQTDTYKGKNIGNGRHWRRQRYKEGKSY